MSGCHPEASELDPRVTPEILELFCFNCTASGFALRVATDPELREKVIDQECGTQEVISIEGRGCGPGYKRLCGTPVLAALQIEDAKVQ